MNINLSPLIEPIANRIRIENLSSYSMNGLSKSVAVYASGKKVFHLSQNIWLIYYL
jgi:hypothetical protein